MSWMLSSVATLSGCASNPSDQARAGNDAASASVADSTVTNSRSGQPQANPLLDDRLPDQRHALPELSFRHLGMHIGGEENTPERKEPFLSAISDRSESILTCYRWVNDPAQGGSFGVDLYIEKSGGHPEVRAVRQKIGGPELVKCMTEAFSAVEFRPGDRPTMVSYSLLFVMDDRT